MNHWFIQNIHIVNEGACFKGSILIGDGYIAEIFPENSSCNIPRGIPIIDGNENYLLPGIIDMHVHFREPGLTHKGDMSTESSAAAAGGVTSVCEMPNTNPPTISNELLCNKYQCASESSITNYAFYPGATNHNTEWLLQIPPSDIPGVKVFLGASTGDLLLEDSAAFEMLLKNSNVPVMVHAEDNDSIQRNIELYSGKYHGAIPPREHINIRSRESCMKASEYAIEMACRYQARLHLLHVTTREECALIQHEKVKNKFLSAEACTGHLSFNEYHYNTLGNLIKVNPSIKCTADQKALIEAVRNNYLDLIATDHAPHLYDEKQQDYLNAPSGMPLIQHSLHAMIEYYFQGVFSLEQIVRKMCHAPADILKIKNRGYIREGYFADLVMVDLKRKWTVNKENILYKCNWSPFEGASFRSSVINTWINGFLVYDKGLINRQYKGQKLSFNR